MRARYIDAVGQGVVKFQEAANTFDELAAEILALGREDLPCMTQLLFGGPASIDALAAELRQPRTRVARTVGRLEAAGYARRAANRVELTGYSRDWISRIWHPLGEASARLLGSHSTSELATLARFMARVAEIQERHIRRLAASLQAPEGRSPRRGGLSPAALKRVQTFVEANLDGAIHLRDLATRAGLSVYHFARAFKTSSGITPRAFVEARRVERASHLLVHSDMPIAQVALAAGLGTQSRLTTVFKRQTGFTPAEFRRQRR